MIYVEGVFTSERCDGMYGSTRIRIRSTDSLCCARKVVIVVEASTWFSLTYTRGVKVNIKGARIVNVTHLSKYIKLHQLIHNTKIRKHKYITLHLPSNS